MGVGLGEGRGDWVWMKFQNAPEMPVNPFASEPNSGIKSARDTAGMGTDCV